MINPVVIYQPVQDADVSDCPAMLALNPQQRAFVLAHVALGGEDATKAARAAGYGGDNPTSVKVQAYRLTHSPKVRLAIKEIAESKIHAQAAYGAQVLVEIARDPTHKDRYKAATEIMNRSGMMVVQKVEHDHIHRAEDDAEKVRRIVLFAQQMGMDPRKLLGGAKELQGVTLDAQFEIVDTEVEPSGSAEGLEDLL